MGTFDFSVDLTELQSDLRSNELAYKISIQNRGIQTLHLLSITPFLPDSVKLSEARDQSFAAVSEQHDTIAKELDTIVQTVLDTEESILFAKRVEIGKEWIRQVFSGMGFLGIYVSMFSGQMAKQMGERLRKERAFRYSIENYQDGLNAQSVFINKSSLAEALKELYRLKLEKLNRLEQRIGGGIQASTLASIQPSSIFSTTYVLCFKRRPLSARKYNISFEVSVAEEGKSEGQVSIASASPIISPQGYVLNLIVVLSSILGVILKTAVDPILRAAAMKIWTEPFGLGWPLAYAVIVALVFFNVYEFSNLADRFKMALSWRSALLIGVLCGLMSDRVIAALQAFLK